VDPAASAPPAVLYQPASVQVGPFAVTPRLGWAVGRNDNVTLAPPTGRSALLSAPVKSGFVAATPEVTAALAHGDDHYQLNLHGELTRFDGSPANDTDNVELSLDGLNLLDSRTAVAWRGSVQDWHDAAGSTDLSLQAATPDATPDHYRARAVGAVVRHDSDDGRHRVEAEATVSNKRYLNHRDVTVVGDVDTRSLVGRYLYAASVGPALITRWLGEVRTQQSHYPSYPDVLTSLDNRDTRVLLGAQWELAQAAQGASTAPVTGSVKLGLQHKDFDAMRPAYRGVTWDALLHWSPRDRTLFDLASGRAAADSPGDGSNEVVVRQVTLAWTELWRSDWRSSLTLVAGGNHYNYTAGLGVPTRQDRVASCDLAVRYDLRRTVQVGVNLGVARRRSSVPAFDYTRHLNAVALQVAW
jgi:hypothetical protein